MTKLKAAIRGARIRFLDRSGRSPAAIAISLGSSGDRAAIQLTSSQTHSTVCNCVRKAPHNSLTGPNL
jgi:hypothetical protein